MDTLKEVKMNAPSIIDLIVKVRSLEDHGATPITHTHSNARPGTPIPCTDKAITKFVQKLLQKEEAAILIIGEIDWEESGNCVGDELYESTIRALLLPDGRYFIELKYYNNNNPSEEHGFIKKEYVWKF